MSVPIVTFSNPDDLSKLLEGMRDVLMHHPIAAQAAFSALVREGRRFSQTPEGKAHMERLAASELLPRLRLVWDTLGMHAFVEEPDEAIPSFFLDGAVQAATLAGLEPLLSSVFEERDE